MSLLVGMLVEEERKERTFVAGLEPAILALGEPRLAIRPHELPAHGNRALAQIVLMQEWENEF